MPIIKSWHFFSSMSSRALRLHTFADARFLIRSKNIWDTRIYVVKTSSWTIFWWYCSRLKFTQVARILSYTDFFWFQKVRYNVNCLTWKYIKEQIKTMECFKTGTYKSYLDRTHNNLNEKNNVQIKFTHSNLHSWVVEIRDVMLLHNSRNRKMFSENYVFLFFTMFEKWFDILMKSFV